MAKKYMERIEALRQQYLATRVDMDVYNAKYVTEGFKDTEGQPWIIQKATGYKYECERKQIYIQDHELLVGGVGFKPRCGILNPDSASGVIEKEVDTISNRPFDPFFLSEEGKQVYLNDVKDYWKNKCVLDRWNLMLPEDVKRLRANGAIFIDRKAVRGYGETTADWRMIVNKGIGALKKEAEEALAKLDDAVPGDLEKSFFYKSEIMVAEAIIHLSHRHAEATEDVKFKEPNLSVTYSISKNPDSLLNKAVECIGMGLTMPAVYSNDVGVRMMLNKGVPLSEAWDWNPCGCVETNLSGKLKEYTDIADINMGAMVEFALNDGKSRITGEQVSVHTGDPRDFKTFEDFFAAVKKHIDFAVDAITSANQLLDYLSMNYRPVPALSLGFPHCMEVGMDYSQPGAAKYSVGGGVITVGQADIVNSVAAVKYLVFDEKKLTMDQLVKALDADFVGYEDVQAMCLTAPKYGNDDERADFCVGEIFTHVVDQFEKYDTKFGKMTCGMLPVSGNTPIGQWVGALPSGRNAKTPLTDGIGATGGTDVNGPSALLKSVSRIPHARFTQGTQLNMKFEPEMLQGELGIAHGMNMLKTMCMLDVYHAQINCVDRQTLLDAQAHPEAHRDLLIRVAGYTAFFVELGKETQDEIIGRTEIGSWAGCGCCG